MNRKSILCGFATMGFIAMFMPGAHAADMDKPSAEVQARVTKVIKSNFPDAVIKEMEKDSEDGLSFISVDFTSKGTTVEADVTEDGTLVESDVTVDIKAFPKAAAKALKKATKGMKITETDIATTYAEADANDKTGMKAIKLAEPTIAYEMSVEKDGKEGEFSVDANGKLLESPEWASGASAAKEGKDDKD